MTFLCRWSSFADRENFVEGGGGVKFDNVFLLDEGIEDPNTTKKMPSSARQRAFRWRADDGQTLNTGLVAVIFQGIRTSIAKKPYIIPVLWFFGGWEVQTPASSVSAHDLLVQMKAQLEI